MNESIEHHRRVLIGDHEQAKEIARAAHVALAAAKTDADRRRLRRAAWDADDAVKAAWDALEDFAHYNG